MNFSKVHLATYKLGNHFQLSIKTVHILSLKLTLVARQHLSIVQSTLQTIIIH